MFEKFKQLNQEAKERAERQVIDELVLFCIIAYEKSGKGNPSTEWIVTRCTQNGKISVDKILESLNRMTDGFLIHNANSWQVKNMSDHKKICAEIDKNMMARFKPNDKVNH